jgi:hypothetical protein
VHYLQTGKPVSMASGAIIAIPKDRHELVGVDQVSISRISI